VVSLRVVASGLQNLRIVTSYLRKNQSVDNRKIFDVIKIGDSFHGSLGVSASCDELFMDISELLTDVCD